MWKLGPLNLVHVSNILQAARSGMLTCAHVHNRNSHDGMVNYKPGEYTREMLFRLKHRQLRRKKLLSQQGFSDTLLFMVFCFQFFFLVILRQPNTIKVISELYRKRVNEPQHTNTQTDNQNYNEKMWYPVITCICCLLCQQENGANLNSQVSFP